MKKKTDKQTKKKNCFTYILSAKPFDRFDPNEDITDGIESTCRIDVDKATNWRRNPHDGKKKQNKKQNKTKRCTEQRIM